MSISTNSKRNSKSTRGKSSKPPGPTALARKQRAAKLARDERANKIRVRERDRHCRFPLCGCIENYGARFLATVSHDVHKGMGGDPTGERSKPEVMLLLCKWRHQDAPVSRHKGTLRTIYLSDEKADGPLAFEVLLSAVYPGSSGGWFEVAREHYVEGGSGALRLEPLTPEQSAVLLELGKMVR